MYFVDFMFDGIRLSDFGCVVGSAVTGNNDAVNMGSVINLETITNHGSYLAEIVNADYQEMYSVTFDVVKIPCGSYDDTFTDKEATFFMRWLNRKDYCKFVPLYDDEHSFNRQYMMGTFTTVQAINMGGEIIGFSLTFTSNSPFSYLDYNPIKFHLDYTNNYKFSYSDPSDELGSAYPKKFIVTIKEIYDKNNNVLRIHNSMDDVSRYTEVKGIKVNEIITFDCIHKVITSSDEHPKLYNDFNYVFPRFVNTLKSNMNTFTFDNKLVCDVEIDYNPIRKAGVIA